MREYRLLTFLPVVASIIFVVIFVTPIVIARITGNQVCTDVIPSRVSSVFTVVIRCRLGFTERTRHLHDFNEAIRPQTPSRLHVSSSRRTPIGFVEREGISRFLPRGLVEHWFEGYVQVIASATDVSNLDGNSADLIEFKSPFDLV
jgi:hypothetical protein